MIEFVTGNILDSKADALVNTVNTVGVMGKGIALQFKNQFPDNYKVYRKACKNKELAIGQLLVTKEEALLRGKKIIINFPTKTHWRMTSEYTYIREGLAELVKVIAERKIQSIAIPPLGAGNGGLNWNTVKSMIVEALKDVDCQVYVFEPNAIIKEVLKKERVKLTPARAMLLTVLYELVRNGEFVSEFTAEKIAYFLQRFGAKKELKLDFKSSFYGPYSGKVRHVLHYLNGSYIMGYSSKDTKPFAELSLIMDTEKEVSTYLNSLKNAPYKKIAETTKSFLQGYYSLFALELLSTIDFIKNEKKITAEEKIIQHLDEWSNRKRTMFSNPDFVRQANDVLERKMIYAQ